MDEIRDIGCFVGGCGCDAPDLAAAALNAFNGLEEGIGYCSTRWQVPWGERGQGRRSVGVWVEVWSKSRQKFHILYPKLEQPFVH
jgi:hypothetical protein